MARYVSQTRRQINQAMGNLKNETRNKRSMAYQESINKVGRILPRLRAALCGGRLNRLWFSSTFSLIQGGRSFTQVLTSAVSVEMAAVSRECSNKVASGALNVRRRYHNPDISWYSNGGVEFEISNADR